MWLAQQWKFCTQFRMYVNRGLPFMVTSLFFLKALEGSLQWWRHWPHRLLGQILAQKKAQSSKCYLPGRNQPVVTATGINWHFQAVIEGSRPRVIVVIRSSHFLLILTQAGEWFLLCYIILHVTFCNGPSSSFGRMSVGEDYRSVFAFCLGC